MTQEEKELLLKDLCARFPYKVKIYCGTVRQYHIIQCIFIDEKDGHCDIMDDFGLGYSIEHVKPYLRSMSSITNEEVKELVKIRLIKYSSNSEYNNLIYIDRISKHDNNIWSAWIHYRTEYGDVKQTCVIVGWVNWETTLEEINWLYRNHFDIPHWIESEKTYKTMIEKGLALEAPENMYNKLNNK